MHVQNLLSQRDSYFYVLDPSIFTCQLSIGFSRIIRWENDKANSPSCYMQAQLAFMTLILWTWHTILYLHCRSRWEFSTTNSFVSLAVKFCIKFVCLLCKTCWSFPASSQMEGFLPCSCIWSTFAFLSMKNFFKSFLISCKDLDWKNRIFNLFSATTRNDFE